MTQPIQRLATTVEDDVIQHDDRPISWRTLERIAGKRLDRRRAYCVIDGAVCELLQYTARCSGCCDDNPYSGRGMGCSECGYHGVRRERIWVPMHIAEAARHVE